MTRATPLWVVTAMVRIKKVLNGLHIRRSEVPAWMSASTGASAGGSRRPPISIASGTKILPGPEQAILGKTRGSQARVSVV